MGWLRLWIGVLLAASIPDDELPLCEALVAQIATGVQAQAALTGGCGPRAAPSEQRLV